MTALETYDKALRALALVLVTDPGNLSVRLLGAKIRVQQAGTCAFGGNPAEDIQQLTSAVSDSRVFFALAPEDLSTLQSLVDGLQLLTKGTSAGGGVTENVGAAQSEIFYRKAAAVLQTALQTHLLESDLI